MATPTMLESATGVSMMRSAPTPSVKPSEARKPPPRRPARHRGGRSASGKPQYVATFRPGKVPTVEHAVDRGQRDDPNPRITHQREGDYGHREVAPAALGNPPQRHDDHNEPDPAERRDGSRMMVLHRAEQRIEHRMFADFASYLKSGDLVALNDTRVIPARAFSADGKTALPLP